jgi:hypothetical protein
VPVLLSHGVAHVAAVRPRRLVPVCNKNHNAGACG